MSNTVRKVQPVRCAWCGHYTMPKHHKRRGDRTWCSGSCGWKQGVRGRHRIGKHGEGVSCGDHHARPSKATKRKRRDAGGAK